MSYKPVVGALVFAVVTVLVGALVGFVLKTLKPVEIPAECRNWNKHHIMEITLFITGAIVWLISYGVSERLAK